MPKFGPIPKPVGAQYLQEEITANVISTVGSQLSAPLGVNTVEEWIPQPDDDPMRQYNQSQMPAVWCWTMIRGTGTGAPAQMAEYLYEVHFGAAVFDAQVKTGRKTLERIIEEIITLFEWLDGSCSFLDETHTQTWFDGFSRSEPTLGTKERPYLFWAEATMDVRVMTPNVNLE